MKLTRRFALPLPLALLLCVGMSELRAQPTAPLAIPDVQLTDAEQKFDETVRTFERHLYDSGAFAVDVTSHWTYSGTDKETRGTNLYHLAVQKGGKYRIEAGSREKGKAQYLCVSDGRQVIRLHRPAKCYSQQPASVTQDDLQHDALTLQTLAGSGVEFLIQPQMRAQLIAQISNIRFIGDELLDGQRLLHLQLALHDKRQIDVWFTQQEKPMLVKLVTTERIAVSNDQTIELATTSTFQWQVGGPLPAGTFTLDLPANGQQVDDLMTALRQGDIPQLLGQPAPLLQLNDLQGSPVRLADYRGKNVIVLIFWASWCAASTNNMDTLNTFVEQAEQGGAKVLAINLGETVQQVRESVQLTQYRGKVLLDPETKSLDVYRFGELPMTVLIGKEGTIQSFQSGSTAEARQRIREQTIMLLEGKSLIPNGQRK